MFNQRYNSKHKHLQKQYFRTESYIDINEDIRFYRKKFDNDHFYNQLSEYKNEKKENNFISNRINLNSYFKLNEKEKILVNNKYNDKQFSNSHNLYKRREYFL